MKWLWSICLMWLLILGGCGSSDSPTLPPDEDVPCFAGESRCNGTMIQHCGAVGFFRDYDDCAVISQLCGMRLGQAVCYVPGGADTTSDSDSFADSASSTATVGTESDSDSDSDSWSETSTASTDHSDTASSTVDGGDSATGSEMNPDSDSDIDTTDTEAPLDTGCGDGMLQVTEACDDGNRVSDDGCSGDCREVEAGWNCAPNDGRCYPVSFCGDGDLQSVEQCDDNDNEGGDGCSADCQVELGWSCSGEPSDCYRVTCGNGVIERGETCDDGNLAPFDGCDVHCQLEPDCVDGVCASLCGDGIKNVDEECDDGNQLEGDGCSADCVVEAGYACIEGEHWGDALEIPVIYKDFEEGDDDFDQFSLTEVQEVDGGCTRVSTGMLEDTLNSRGKPRLNPDYDDPDVGKNPDQCNDVQSDASFAAWYTHDQKDEAVVLSTMVLWKNTDGGYVNRWLPDGTMWSRILDFEPEEPDYQALWCGEGGDNQRCADHACADGEEFDSNDMLCFYPCEPWMDKDYSCAVRFEELDAPEPFDGNPVFFPVDGKGVDNDRWEAGISEAIFEGMHISEESFIEANGVSVPGNYDFEHNFFFTSEMRMWFKYESRGHMQIEVVADDDTWVFVNGRLAIDLGGIHRPAGGDADLQDGADDFGLEDGGIYEIAIFHAERYRDVSAFRLTLSGFESPRSRCASECGDGILTAGEQCDDGVNDGGYNKCAPGCTLDVYCGDGMIQEEYEDCDDGNLENGDECPNSCVRGELH